MLRISRVEQGSSIILKLEGKLLEPWVSELRKICHETGNAVCLDLASVSFVDASGLELLNDLLAGGASIVSCSNFVTELLQA